MDLIQTRQALETFGKQQKRLAAAAEAAGNTAMAERCEARAKAAKKGWLLDGPEEWRDANYSMENQNLRGDAIRHGITVSQPLSKE
jgi:hypothetical protein